MKLVPVLWALAVLSVSADAMLLTMLLRRSSLGSMLPKPVIKVYRDLDSGPGHRSGFKVGIDATFGGNNHKEKYHHDEYEDGALASKHHQHQHDDYKLQQGDYDLHRYQKSPSITFEIRAPDEPRHAKPTYEHSDHYRPRFKTAYGGAPSGNASSGESSYSLRNIIKRRRKTTRRTTPPPLPPPPPPPPQVLVLPSYRKELMVPDYKFGPYKGHSLMGFTYDAEDVLFAKS
ncbi:unnamed protein product [Ixodes pacificus]